MAHSQLEPLLVIAIGIAGLIGFTFIEFYSTALCFLLAAICGACEYRATRHFNEEQASDGF